MLQIALENAEFEANIKKKKDDKKVAVWEAMEAKLKEKDEQKQNENKVEEGVEEHAWIQGPILFNAGLSSS